MRLTVVMTTYNAGPHLADQVASIEAQTVSAAEWLIGDDCSTDGTWSELQRLAERPEVDVRQSVRNMGLRANIEALLGDVTGDVVVLADQDDVWEPEKLAAVRRAFADPTVSLWCSDAQLIDAAGDALGRTAWDAVHFDEAARRQINSPAGLRRLLHGQTVTGATMAVRRDVLRLALPLPVELEGEDHLFLHDGWLSALAACLGRVVVDPRPLVRYRQHAGQTTAMSMTVDPGGVQPSSTYGQLHVDKLRVGLVASRLRGVDTVGAAFTLRLARFLGLRLRVADGAASPLAVFRAAPDYLRFARALTLAKDVRTSVGR